MTNQVQMLLRPNPDRGGWIVLGAILTLIIMALAGCRSYQPVVVPDLPSAVNIRTDTVLVDSARVTRVDAPGFTRTAPDTVTLFKQENSAPVAEISEIVIDSTHVRVIGKDRALTFRKPAFGETLFIKPDSQAVMTGHVVGRPVERVIATPKEPPWIARHYKWMPLYVLMTLGALAFISGFVRRIFF